MLLTYNGSFPENIFEDLTHKDCGGVVKVYAEITTVIVDNPLFEVCTKKKFDFLTQCPGDSRCPFYEDCSKGERIKKYTIEIIGECKSCGYRWEFIEFEVDGLP